MDEKVNPNIQMWTIKILSKHLCLSPRTLWRLNSAGKLPKSLRIGGAVRFRASDIELWQEKGCPDQRTFEAMRGVTR